MKNESGRSLVEYGVIAFILALLTVIAINFWNKRDQVTPLAKELKRQIEVNTGTSRYFCENELESYSKRFSTSNTACTAIFLKDIRDELKRHNHRGDCLLPEVEEYK